jgi:hypothetical protein
MHRQWLYSADARFDRAERAAWAMRAERREALEVADDGRYVQGSEFLGENWQLGESVRGLCAGNSEDSQMTSRKDRQRSTKGGRMVKRFIKLTVYEDAAAEFRWRASHGNGKIIADSAAR